MENLSENKVPKIRKKLLKFVPVLFRVGIQGTPIIIMKDIVVDHFHRELRQDTKVYFADSGGSIYEFITEDIEEKSTIFDSVTDFKAKKIEDLPFKKMISNIILIRKKLDNYCPVDLLRFPKKFIHMSSRGHRRHLIGAPPGLGFLSVEHLACTPPVQRLP